MTKILGLSGKKQSGKNTSANFLLGIELATLSFVKRFTITEKGELYVDDFMGDISLRGTLDINYPNTQEHIGHLINPYIKIYAFADMLKQRLCMDILGLTYEQCYGTNEDKNSLTKLKWEDMPGVYCTQPTKTLKAKLDSLGFIYHEPGFMTAREVLQYVGTKIFRRMYGNVWVDATMKQIKKDSPLIAIITDIRFPNEVEAVLQEPEGKVLRYLRNVLTDNDESECALDADRYDQSRFSAVMDNSKMSIEEQIEATHEQLVEWGWAEHHGSLMLNRELVTNGQDA